MFFFPVFTEVLSGGIPRYVTEAYATNDMSRISGIVSTMFPLLCIAAVLLLGIGGLLASQINMVINVKPEFVDQARFMLMMIVAIEALRLPIRAFSSGFFATQRLVLLNLISVSCEIFRIALLITLLTTTTPSITYVVISTVVASTLEMTIILFVSRALLPAQRFMPALFNRSIVKEMIHFGGWSSVYGISGMLRKSSDPIILNRLASPLDVACFNLGALIPNRLEGITNQSFLGAILPHIISLNANSQHKQIKSIYLRIGRYALWGMLLVCTPLIVFHDQIVRLYVGDTFAQAGYVLVLLVACYPMIYGNILYTVLANAKSQMKSLAIREFLATLLNISLTILFVWYFNMGALGSASATFICYGLGSILIYWPFGKSMANATWHEIFHDILIPGLPPFIIYSILLFALDINYPAMTWLYIFSYSVCGGIFYMLSIWYFSLPADRILAAEALTALRQKLFNTR